MNIWFSSDCHFQHTNLLNLTPETRPFKTIEEMDNTLINNWNSLVKPEDTIYHLGDFAWNCHKSLISRLKGNIIFVLGNHDKVLKQIYPNIPSILDITVNKQPIVLCHYAMRVWNKSHHGSWHLYGHSHGGLPDDLETWSTDVGMDRWGLKPVSFNQLQELFSKRPNKLIKAHHKKELEITVIS